MEVFDHPEAMALWSNAQRVAGRRVGFVPTMGALHDGHLALIDAARRSADVVVVSLFVNPLQFNRRDDFDAYPRPISDDLHICEAQGVDAVYAPTAAAMYPTGFQTFVDPGALGETLEGAERPGHFRGVTTVVTKLFGATRPHVAVFGQKDYQQAAIIRQMVADLNMGIELVTLATVRDPDGLAMSSRNRRLSAEQRAAAVCVPAALAAVAALRESGVTDVAQLINAGRRVIEAEPLARFEHLELVSPDSLQRTEGIDGPFVALLAVWFGDVRLIDNRILS